MTTATKTSTIVTEAQLAATHRITKEQTGEAFYIVESATTDAEYKVSAIRQNNEWVITCTCPAGNPPVDENGVLLYPIRECWHKRAAAAAAEEFKAALKAAAQSQAKIDAQKPVAVAAPVKRIIDTVPAWMLTGPVASHMKKAPREF